MDICDGEILKTEKFGSRDYPTERKEACCMCKRAYLWEEFFCDATGNFFCSQRCRDKKFEDRKGEKKNDKKRAYADLLP